MSLVYVVFTDRNDLNWILKILWTYLHLRSLHRVVVVFPMVPHHSLSINLAVKIQTIQVGRVAIVVPPCAVILHGTVIISAAVIVTIFGGKWISSVRSKGISSGTLKKRPDNNTTVNYSQCRFAFISYSPVSLPVVLGEFWCDVPFKCVGSIRPGRSVPGLIRSLGGLRYHDGDGHENVARKVNLGSFNLYRDDFNSFTLSNATNYFLSRVLIIEPYLSSEREGKLSHCLFTSSIKTWN